MGTASSMDIARMSLIYKRWTRSYFKTVGVEELKHALSKAIVAKEASSVPGFNGRDILMLKLKDNIPSLATIQFPSDLLRPDILAFIAKRETLLDQIGRVLGVELPRWSSLAVVLAKFGFGPPKSIFQLAAERAARSSRVTPVGLPILVIDNSIRRHGAGPVGAALLFQIPLSALDSPTIF